jgi:hypothetical protein
MQMSDSDRERINNYVAGRMAVALVLELDRRGMPRGLIGDAMLTVGAAAAIEARGVDAVVAELRAAATDIEQKREQFHTGAMAGPH